ncbi:MAG: hypothetical protein NWR51_13390 [Akkermansiaceae bacterium]|nr:hypothetical protein [Akkermansiaceae bacterium]
MIPERKKTPEEIAALREDLGIPDSPPPPHQQVTPPQPAPQPETPTPPRRPPVHLEPEITNKAPEPVAQPVHLNVPAAPAPLPDAFKKHTLRKRELPLAPAPPVTHKTAIPTHRHDPRDIAQIRKREAIAKLNLPDRDPALHLRKQTAHPLLYIPGYLLAIGAAVTIYKHFHHITPLALLLCSLLIVIFIALKKPRSRHHAALIFIVIFLTAAFGGIHYAPLFQNAP